MKNIIHRLTIGASVGKDYEALTTQEGLAGWWTPETTAKPEIGSIARFAFGPDYWRSHAKGTTLLFSHDGWKEHTTLFAVCSYDWAIFPRSLKFLGETGKGYAYPNQNK